jgi:TonB family protein
MDTGAVAHAPPGASRHAALLQRLFAFICASIALHALILVVYSPRGSGALAYQGDAPVLHARLAPTPSDPVPDVVAEADRSASGVDPAPSPAPGAGASSTAAAGPAGGGMPMPEKWYTATELSVLAQPLVMPALRYPEELAGTGVSAKVRVKVFVDELGVVRKTEVVQSAPHRAFEAAAMAAWEDVRFTPAIKDGRPVKSQKLLEFDFEP